MDSWAWIELFCAGQIPNSASLVCLVGHTGQLRAASVGTSLARSVLFQAGLSPATHASVRRARDARARAHAAFPGRARVLSPRFTRGAPRSWRRALALRRRRAVPRALPPVPAFSAAARRVAQAFGWTSSRRAALGGRVANVGEGGALRDAPGRRAAGGAAAGRARARRRARRLVAPDAQLSLEPTRPGPARRAAAAPPAPRRRRRRRRRAAARRRSRRARARAAPARPRSCLGARPAHARGPRPRPWAARAVGRDARAARCRRGRRGRDAHARLGGRGRPARARLPRVAAVPRRARVCAAPGLCVVLPRLFLDLALVVGPDAPAASTARAPRRRARPRAPCCSSSRCRASTRPRPRRRPHAARGRRRRARADAERDGSRSCSRSPRSRSSAPRSAALRGCRPRARASRSAAALLHPRAGRARRRPPRARPGRVPALAAVRGGAHFVIAQGFGWSLYAVASRLARGAMGPPTSPRCCACYARWARPPPRHRGSLPSLTRAARSPPPRRVARRRRRASAAAALAWRLCAVLSAGDSPPRRPSACAAAAMALCDAPPPARRAARPPRASSARSRAAPRSRPRAARS